MYIYIPGIVMYLNIKTNEILCPSPDLRVAVEVFGHQKRLKLFGKQVFNKKRRILTGKIFKFVKELDADLGNMDALNATKSKPENTIWFDVNRAMNAYEFEPYYALSTDIIDCVEPK